MAVSENGEKEGVLVVHGSSDGAEQPHLASTECVGKDFAQFQSVIECQNWIWMRRWWREESRPGGPGWGLTWW